VSDEAVSPRAILCAALRAYQDAATAVCCAEQPSFYGPSACRPYLRLVPLCDAILHLVWLVAQGRGEPEIAVRAVFGDAPTDAEHVPGFKGFDKALVEAIREDLLQRLAGKPSQMPSAFQPAGRREDAA
jgi:hypothetical protein